MRRAVPLLAALVGVGAAACTGSGGADLPDTTPRVQVTSAAGTLESTFPARLQALCDPAGTIYQFDVSAGDGTNSWFAEVSLPESDLLAGASNLTISSDPHASAGTVEIVTPTLTFADSGTLTLLFGKGTVSGTAAVVPESVSATFSGMLDVGCWVPVTSQNANPAGGTSGPGALVEDPELANPSCAPLRAWRK